MTRHAWGRARSLAERPADGVADEGGRERRTRWQQTIPDPELLDERLGHAGHDLESLAAALSDTSAVEGEPPDWWAVLRIAYPDHGTSPVALGDDEERGLNLVWGGLRLAAPIARLVGRRLRVHARERADVARLLTERLAGELAEIAAPALAFDLLATRAAEGWPEGESRQRSLAWMADLGRSERARELFADFSVSARRLVDHAGLAENAGRDLLDRLEQDGEVLRNLLGDAAIDDVTGLRAAGDSHDGGRRVTVLSFASGARIVFKPRSLAMDAAYQGLLSALNERGFEPRFRVLRLVRAGAGHGWQEFCERAPCAEPAQIERYFRRLGAQMALLHALRATDMHFENLLACGEHPVIVDLETLLHPRLGGEGAPHADPMLAATGMDCVLRVGLLPREDANFRFDISGIGNDPDRTPTFEAFTWEGSGSDVRHVKRTVERERASNVPYLGERPVHPRDHLPAIERGFRDAYTLLVAHRDELLELGCALAAFDDVDVRIIFRPTRVYAELLRQETLDPAILADGRDREAHLNALWRGGRRRADLRQVVPAEHHDLWVGDVPKLTGRPGSGDVHHHELGTMAGALGPHRVPRADDVRRLDGEDLERQLHFIRTAIVAADVRTTHGGGGAGPRLTTPDADWAALVASAVDRLGVLALHDGDRAGWLVPQRSETQGGSLLTAAGPSLVGGHAGIALALAHAAPWHESARGLVRAAFATLVDLVADAEADAAGGMLVAFAAARRTLSEAEREPVADAAELLVTRVPTDDESRASWVVGTAGALSACLVSDKARGRLADVVDALARSEAGSPLVPVALARAASLLERPDLAEAAATRASALTGPATARLAAQAAVADAGRLVGAAPPGAGVAPVAACDHATDDDGPGWLLHCAARQAAALGRGDEEDAVAARRDATTWLERATRGEVAPAGSLERSDLGGLAGVVLGAVAIVDRDARAVLPEVLSGHDDSEARVARRP